LRDEWDFNLTKSFVYALDRRQNKLQAGNYLQLTEHSTHRFQYKYCEQSSHDRILSPEEVSFWNETDRDIWD